MSLEKPDKWDKLAQVVLAKFKKAVPVAKIAKMKKEAFLEALGGDEAADTLQDEYYDPLRKMAMKYAPKLGRKEHEYLEEALEDALEDYAGDIKVTLR